jgi:O-antigen/teichoic acid export membrane protein
MIQKRRLLINAMMSIGQILLSSCTLFILYRFLLNTIGAEKMGIWSLVLATTAITRIGGLGIPDSVVKFVAKYIAHAEYEIVSRVIQTAVISVALFIGLMLLAAYPLADWLLAFIVPESRIMDAISILPYAFISLWIVTISSVFQAGLDGYQRIDLRSLILMGGAVLYLILCFALVPTYGLLGLAYAQVIQVIAILIAAWYSLRLHLQILPVIPYRWYPRLFREMFSYGINIQIASVSNLLYDPITKALLSKFGGLAMVGYYEMASRMIYQVRSLIVSANQVLVPVIADLHERGRVVILGVYRDSYHLLLFIALIFFSLIVALTPIISEFWIGYYENTFVLFTLLLAVGWFLNILNAPAYIANLGIGELRYNTISHIVIGLLNIALGFTLGSLYGSMGVIVGWGFSLAIGSSIICISFHLVHRIPFWELLPRESIGVGFACLVGVFAALLLYYRFHYSWHLAELTIVILSTIFAVQGIPAWAHPMRKRLAGWFVNELLHKKKEMEYIG